MARHKVVEHIISSDKIAFKASETIPALCAKRIHGDVLINIDNQYYLVFDWVEGKSIFFNEITTNHCEIIGDILARIHNIDFSHINIKSEELTMDFTNWSDYLLQGKMLKTSWVDSYEKLVNNLYEYEEKSYQASKELSKAMVISHRDLDPKNVLWNQFDPIIIDWEASLYIHPMHDLIETALYWSINKDKDINKDKFFAFINSYKKRIGRLQANWNIVLEIGFKAKLNWLKYNLDRSLSTFSTDEKQQGTEQVIETIQEIKQYKILVSTLLEWLKEV